MWERLGRYLWAAGDCENAMEAYGEALRRVPADPPSAARARVLAARGQSLMLLARFEEARACCERAITIARAVGARAEEGHALNTLGCSLAYLGEPSGAVTHLRAALEIAREVHDLDDLGRAYQNLSEILGGPLNRLEEALAVALEGRKVAQSVGLARDYGVSLEVNAASALFVLGRWQEAATILRTAEERRPADMAAIEVHLCRARLAIATGEFEQAARAIEDSRRAMGHILDPQFHATLCAREAELSLWQGRPTQAAEAVRAGLASLDDSDDTWFLGPLLWLAAWADADAAIVSPAVESRATQLLAAVGDDAAFVSPVTIAYARMSLAERGRLTEPAPESWAAVAAEWGVLGHPYLQAYAGWREGEALLGRRRSREASCALRAAHTIAQQLGGVALQSEIELLARRARLDLAPAPVVDAPPAASGETRAAAFGLTKRERQVLELIAHGQTNREISQALFVSEKTAAAHVSSILRKLDVRGRVEAATAAHRLGLLADD